MDYSAEAQLHRRMAEEYRTKAELVADEGLRAQYRKLAKAYDGLAVNEVRVADSIKIAS